MEYVAIIIQFSILIVLSFAIAFFIGKRRNIGFQKSLFFCIFLSPIIGFLITILSSRNRSVRPSKVKYISGQIILFFSATALLVFLPKLSNWESDPSIFASLGLAIGLLGLGLYLVQLGKGFEAKYAEPQPAASSHFMDKVNSIKSRLTSTIMSSDSQDNSSKSTIGNLLILAVALLLVAAFVDFEYGYYVFLRITISFITGLYLFLNVRDLENGFNLWNISFLLMFILFNPIKPIPFEEETWMILDIVSACIISYRYYQIRKYS